MRMLLVLSMSVGVAACASATVEVNPAAPLDSAPPQLQPSNAELDPLVDVLTFDDAVLRYGKPLVVDDSREFLHVQWRYGDERGRDCRLKLSFSSVTTRLSTFRFGCD